MSSEPTSVFGEDMHTPADMDADVDKPVEKEAEAEAEAAPEEQWDSDDSEHEVPSVDKFIPVIQDGREVTIKLGKLNPFITCPLCDGYLVDATTVIECMHTFCKSCIHKHLQNRDSCPTCDAKLGPNSLDQLRKDSALQSIVFKVVRGLNKRMEEDKDRFYAIRGLKRPLEGEEPVSVKKATPTTEGEAAKSAVPIKRTQQRDVDPEDQIAFVLKVDEQWVLSHSNANVLVPPEKMAKLKELDRPFIKTSSKATVHHLKKFLSEKLKLDSPKDVDIVLNGEILGQELSLEFVQKTRSQSRNEQLELKFRPNIDLL